ncbi:hypothetical protein B0J14DRAFT_645883 [Halenospora varia]|nr:hypothetical protein B0J14DRAFT_645883 [Halenospora varia]
MSQESINYGVLRLLATLVPWYRKLSNKDDENIGAQVDNDEIYDKKDGTKVKLLYLQPNKNAKNATLRALANQNSHQNLATAEVIIEPAAKEEEERGVKIFDDFKIKV